jgi:hypothetical protein
VHEAPHFAGGRQRFSGEQSVGNVQETEQGEAVVMQRPGILPGDNNQEEVEYEKKGIVKR